MVKLDDGRVVNLSTCEELSATCGINGGCNDNAGERLYKTAKGAYIIKHWSQWQGSCDWFEQVDVAAARAFAAENGMDSDDFAKEFGTESDL